MNTCPYQQAYAKHNLSVLPLICLQIMGFKLWAPLAVSSPLIKLIRSIFINVILFLAFLFDPYLEFPSLYVYPLGFSH